MSARIESRVFSAVFFFSCADDVDGVDAPEGDDVEGGVKESELFPPGESDVEGGVNGNDAGGGGGGEQLPLLKH